MQAKEVGVNLSIETGIDLTNAEAVTLRVRHTQSYLVRELTMTAAGTKATRKTTATDFPDEGLYEIQVSGKFPTEDGRDLLSPMDLLYVGRTLDVPAPA